MNEPGYPNWSTFLFASQIQSVIWFLGIRILDQQMMIQSISFLLYCLAIYNKNQYLLSIKYLKENSFYSHDNSDTKHVGFSPHIKQFDTNYLELEQTPQVKGPVPQNCLHCRC